MVCLVVMYFDRKMKMIYYLLKGLRNPETILS